MTTASAATVTALTLSLPAAPAAVSGSELGTFDSALLNLINAKRAAAGAAPLREVTGLDSASGTWSTSLVGLGRYGAVTPNPQLAAQTLAAAPTRSVFAQSVAKWYPQSVKAADVFALYAGYPQALANMTNRSFKYVGIKTVAAADGTSVASLTYTDNAVAAQIVDPAGSVNPTGALTSATQTGATVALQGKAADPDATTAVQVRITDTVGAKAVTTVAAAAGGTFKAALPLAGYGVHTICATVVNQGAGANLSLGCTTGKLGELVGNLDNLRQSGTQLTAGGWGYDQGAPTTALNATVVVSGPGGSRTVTVLANTSRPDVAAVFPVAGPTHGFLVAVPSMGRGVNTMCVTLLPAQAASVAKKLACRTLTVS